MSTTTTMELSLHVRTDELPDREATFFIHLETNPAGSVIVTRDSANNKVLSEHRIRLFLAEVCRDDTPLPAYPQAALPAL